MFLFARLVGISTYLFITTLFVFYTGTTNKYKNHKIIMFFFLVALVLIAYNHVPYKSSDLFRLIPVMQSYATLSLSDVLGEAINDNSPMLILYYWAIGKFNNTGLLAAITVFIIYAILFIIIVKLKKVYTISPINFSLVIFCVMSTGLFGGAIDNIKTPLVFSLISYCCYREFIEEKPMIESLPIYILAGLIHPAAIALVLIRLFSSIFEHNKSTIKKNGKFLFLSLSFVIGAIIGRDYLYYMIIKAKSYLTVDHYFYIWETIITIINIIIIQYFIYTLKGKYKYIPKGIGLMNCVKFLNIVQVVSLICLIFDYNIFYRFGGIFMAEMLPIVGVAALAQDSKMPKGRKIDCKIVFLLATVSMILSCTRGNLCSLKFFE